MVDREIEPPPLKLVVEVFVGDITRDDVTGEGDGSGVSVRRRVEVLSIELVSGVVVAVLGTEISTELVEGSRENSVEEN